MDNEKLKIEKTWQEQYYGSRDQRNLAVPLSIRNRYLNPPSRPWFPLEQMFQSIGDVRGKDVLCFGCGNENSTIILALKGANVWAFDISEKAIYLQHKMARANGVGGSVRALVADAAVLPFGPSVFDVVFGTAILHHVPDNLNGIARELLRVLKPGGFALFTEPVIGSRLLKRMRSFVPVHTESSPGERPLEGSDLRTLCRYFAMKQVPFCAFARFARFFLPSGVALELSHPIRRAVVYFLFGLDFVLLRLPLLSRLAGVEVLKLAPRERTAVDVRSG